MEKTPSQRRKANNKAIADYMLNNGYMEALECFKKEADFPAEVDPDEVSIQVEDRSSSEPKALASALGGNPWFIVTTTVAQCSIFMLGTSTSPFVIDPLR